MAFSTKIQGNHHLQGNVQVYNVRIPAPFPAVSSGAIRPLAALQGRARGADIVQVYPMMTKFRTGPVIPSCTAIGLDL